MREIKFRAWLKRENRWFTDGFSICESGKQIFGCDEEEYNVGEDVELMQFTGLDDKVGQEIYEGDIVRLFDSVREILFVNGAFGYRGDIKHDYLNFISFAQNRNLVWDGTSILDIGIIGNVYENPELLGPNV